MKLRLTDRWRRVLGILFVVVAFGFLAFLVVRNVGELRAHDWSVHPTLLVLSVLVNVIGLAWGVWVWKLLLRRMDVRVDYLPLCRVWFVSGLGRYIPGKVWQFVGAAHLGPAAGLTPAVALSSLAVHAAFFIISALFVGIYLVPAPLGDPLDIAVDLLRWAAPALLLLAHPSVIGAGLRLVQRATSGKVAPWRGRWWDGAWLVVLSAVGWGFTGAALYLFILSLTPMPASAAPGIVGINALAFVIGYSVFIAPAGLGAKEGVLTVLLALYVSAPVAALLAVATRLWSLPAEVIPALLLLRRASPFPPPERHEIPGDDSTRA